MPIQLNISPRIIPSIAGLYNDSHRMYMEFIDNAIDSAEEYFDANTNAYKKEILITFVLSDDRIWIEDNCSGIENLEKVVQSIGNSDKKHGTFTNGKFGFGIYAFMSACQTMEIISKYKGQYKANKIPINRKQFETDNMSDVQFPDLKSCDFKYDSGTKVILSAFDDKKISKTTDFEKIKNEVELHFERLLDRKNLQILLVNKNDGKEYPCNSFDYSQYVGEEYEDTLDKVSFVKGRVKKQNITFPLPKPILIYLLITKDKYINKPPIFVLKGRRISKIKDIKQFDSKHKSDIWGHPNITGFVDLGDFLEPTIARTEFQSSDKVKALFNTLKELEPLILDEIRNVNKDSETQHYKSFEDHINRMLSKIAREDKMLFRTEILSGNEINVLPGANREEIEEGFGSEHHRNGPPSGVPTENPSEPVDDPYGFGSTEEAGKDVSDYEDEGDLASNKQPDNEYEDTGLKGREKKKPGFNMQFVEGDPIIDAETNKPMRSQLVGGTIRIFRNHPDFESRIKKTSSKEPKITQRLSTYVSIETMVHYKDRQQMREGQAEYNIKMYISLSDYILKLENLCSVLVGRNLKDFAEK